jgi:hypothetical protein
MSFLDRNKRNSLDIDYYQIVELNILLRVVVSSLMLTIMRFFEELLEPVINNHCYMKTESVWYIKYL